MNGSRNSGGLLPNTGVTLGIKEKKSSHSPIQSAFDPMPGEPPTENWRSFCASACQITDVLQVNKAQGELGTNRLEHAIIKQEQMLRQSAQPLEVDQ